MFLPVSVCLSVCLYSKIFVKFLEGMSQGTIDFWEFFKGFSITFARHLASREGIVMVSVHLSRCHAVCVSAKLRLQAHRVRPWLHVK